MASPYRIPGLGLCLAGGIALTATLAVVSMGFTMWIVLGACTTVALFSSGTSLVLLDRERQSLLK